MPPPKRWTPPPEPEKPAVPYVAGFTVAITEHAAPPPFGGPPTLYPAIKMPYDTSQQFLKTVTQTELVVTCPPIQTESNGTNGKKPTKATINIAAAIAVQDERGPQVVLCTIILEDGNYSGAFTAVAKIFDPLYYSFRNKYAPDRPTSTPMEADRDYSIEAAAYAHLNKTGHTGAFAPLYYGCWTFKLPIRHAGVNREREVRLLLVEYVDGVCMRELCYGKSAPDSFTEKDRLDVLARILDGYVRIRHSGIDQRDLVPRNIMLMLGKMIEGSLQAVKRVVLIDYNISVVFHLSSQAQKYRQVTLELPQNPMEIFWTASLDSFGHWVPEEWRGDNGRFQQEWLMKRFGGGSAARYAPVSKKLELDAPDI